ncbi:MAG TPA: D-alanyl-D-alanine carboxypeptidase, partial [Saprospiraceae bacterium]|nr:D-alanyl-D-alanine carboxypeptidase [Saprospiraceae bacterium]
MPAYRCICTGLFICLSTLLIPAELSAHSGPDKKQLKKIIREFLSDSLLKHASVGFVLQDLETGRPIYAVDADRSLVPASTQKIISTALALYVLGPDFRYRTPVLLNGTADPDGSFNGNLLAIGSGDPSFASESMPGAVNFESLALQIYEALQRKGINHINGRIIVDRQFIRDVPENAEWLWYDLGNYYGAGCFALNFMENQARISLRAAQQDEGTCEIFRVQPEPLTALYQSKVKGLSAIGSSDVYVLGSSLQTRHEIHGFWKCCSRDTLMIRSAIPDPAGLFESMLKAELVRKGMLFSDK